MLLGVLHTSSVIHIISAREAVCLSPFTDKASEREGIEMPTDFFSSTWVLVDPPFKPHWGVIPASVLFFLLFLCVCARMCVVCIYVHACFPICIMYDVGGSLKLMLRSIPHGFSTFIH